MKKVILLSLVGFFAASLAFAQAGSVGIFADPAGVECDLWDIGDPGIRLYYVVHVYTTGATASQYRARIPTCLTASGADYLADTNMFSVTLGNSQSGVAVAYGTCLYGPIHTQTIQVFGVGLTPACCRWIIDADPMLPSGKIEGSDCNYVVFYPTGGQGIVNPHSGCTCKIPSEDTTWGHVKALYGE